MKKLFISCLFLAISTVVHSQVPGVLDDLTEIECVIVPKNSKSVNPSGTYPLIPHVNGTSDNWSGYAALTNLRRPIPASVTYVSGTWTVPTITATPDDAYCAVWVGIDGYASGTVEQVGTSHDWIDGIQSNYAWFEMYPRGAYEILGFPVNVGDVIQASVKYKSGTTFVLTIANLTERVITTIPTSYTKLSSAKRSSAEWIVEAPWYNGVLPLSDFGTISFTNCQAKIQGRNGDIDDKHWKYDAITMESPGHIVKAIPSSLTHGGDRFTVTWEHE